MMRAIVLDDVREDEKLFTAKHAKSAKIFITCRGGALLRPYR